ncbi:hypothetical protein [Actinacidiphila acididurans]|uniref:DUF2637 domain-containing protein n=1 Tax=Actinacidiphila acididurans TaxID=2784346 RepID=A0ABS2TN99_9ACTN|nr:hypothetical protein [Actinacidiphila acididurans]MBM9504820.1 hypothetical protein [Actinacidiphila acididurans]
MSTYQEERRKDRSAEAEERRRDAAAAEERRATRRREADERQARLAKQARTDKQADRKARQQARAERKSARAAALTPGKVYRTGTLALVIASALGSLPAQVMHFVGISPMLLPLPLAIEGAAWTMAAGVAHADERKLPGWVRWLLRGLVVLAAGFAASINYQYGLTLANSPAASHTAALGLAAVSLLGPLLFEIRQWVGSLTEKTGTAEDKARRAEDKARREHLARRRDHHKDIAREADRLLSAVPYGSITEEEAFASAWRIHRGAEPGMSAELYAAATNSRVQLGAAFELGEHVRPELLRAGLLASALDPLPQRLRTLGPVTPLDALKGPEKPGEGPEKPQVVNQMPPVEKASEKGPNVRPLPPRRVKGDTPRYSTAAKVAAAETARRSASARVS